MRGIDGYNLIMPVLFLRDYVLLTQYLSFFLLLTDEQYKLNKS